MTSTFEFKAIGTGWKIDIADSLPAEKESALLEKIKERVASFENAYSRFLPDSLVARIRKEPGTYEMPEDFGKMFSTYQSLHDLTGGLFTPLMGKVLSDAGYDPEYSLKERSGGLETPPSMNDVLSFQHPSLTAKEAVSLDFGAAGKGYIIDLVGELLAAEGILEYCVDAGGDMLHRSADGARGKPLRVGLEDPSDFSQVIGVVELRNRSLAASAGSRRKWGRFSHIINPKELSSPKEILAVWTLADSTLVADALATCLFFVPAATLQAHFSFDYVILHSDYSAEKSEGFPGELFLA